MKVSKFDSAFQAFVAVLLIVVVLFLGVGGCMEKFNIRLGGGNEHFEQPITNTGVDTLIIEKDGRKRKIQPSKDLK